MSPLIPRLPAVAAAALFLLAGCGGGERAPLPGTEGAAGGAASAGRPAATSSVPTPPPPVEVETGEPLALKLTGIGGKEEMDHALARLDDPGARELFEQGFRACFVRDSQRRDYGAAMASMQKVLESHPDFAPAYRVIAYCRLNMGFDMAGATQDYEKAVELDPDYGEAHYALSFMLTQFDVERGRKHFERAMELGIPDERKLGEKFYP